MKYLTKLAICTALIAPSIVQGSSVSKTTCKQCEQNADNYFLKNIDKCLQCLYSTSESLSGNMPMRDSLVRQLAQLRVADMDEYRRVYDRNVANWGAINAKAAATGVPLDPPPPVDGGGAAAAAVAADAARMAAEAERARTAQAQAARDEAGRVAAAARADEAGRVAAAARADEAERVAAAARAAEAERARAAQAQAARDEAERVAAAARAAEAERVRDAQVQAARDEAERVAAAARAAEAERESESGSSGKGKGAAPAPADSGDGAGPSGAKPSGFVPPVPPPMPPKDWKPAGVEPEVSAEEVAFNNRTTELEAAVAAAQANVDALNTLKEQRRHIESKEFKDAKSDRDKAERSLNQHLRSRQSAAGPAVLTFNQGLLDKAKQKEVAEASASDDEWE